MLLRPGGLRQDARAQPGCRVLVSSLGLVGGLEHFFVAALHGGQHERVTVGEVKVDRGGRHRNRACHRAQGQGFVISEVAELLHGG